MLAATASYQRDGRLGREHVAVIRRFYHQLPGWIDIETRTHAEADLARLATQYRPDQVVGFAEHLADCLNPDGNYTDNNRAHRRGIILGNQQADGMSALTGWLTPELRATVEAVLAKLAAPGMCNPNDDTPCVDGAPSQDAIDHDPRSAITTASMPRYVQCWRRGSWVSTTGCRRRSSSRPPWPSWKPRPATASPAAGPGSPSPM